MEEKLELDEKYRIANGALDELKNKYKEQEEKKEALRQKIELQLNFVNEKEAKVKHEREVNKQEEERFRKLSHTNAALKAKLKFIQDNYDFTTNVNHLSTDEFNGLMTANIEVNYLYHDIPYIGKQNCEQFRWKAKGCQGRSAEIRIH